MLKKILTALSYTIAGLVFALPANGKLLIEMPDSVFLFSYAEKDGKSGLRFAYSEDGKSWFSVGDGRDFVKSDFGPWGSHKKMYDPVLYQTPGGWRLLWYVSDKYQTIGCAESVDLIKWSPQKYEEVSKAGLFRNGVSADGKKIDITLAGKNYSGTSFKVHSDIARKLLEFSDNVKKRTALNAELAKDDKERFNSLQPLTAVITSGKRASYPISDKLIGIFFEDISYAADGGLYAELIQNRDFEYSPKDCGVKGWGPDYSWKLSLNGNPVDIIISEENPVHENNPHFIRLNGNGKYILSNPGFDGISVKKGEKYDFSLYYRQLNNPKKNTLTVYLVNPSGIPIAKSKIKTGSKIWEKSETVLTAEETASGCSLMIEIPLGNSIDLDLISLFPRNTFKNRKNGLRKDLAQTLADLKPRFVRFPGGCVAHGDGIDNIYDWKGSIGPLYSRKPLRNIWGYHQTRGLGYHEYFQFCEDIGAEPLPVLAAGVPCQNSGSPSHYSTNELTTKGQQCGIPLKDMDAYIQDVLDLIEYANGPSDSKWGSIRAESGHPEPFNLKYIGIGNEDMITEVFEERFKMIHDAIIKAHPEITVIGTVGPFYEGTDYDRGYEFARQENVAIVDEHYYVSPGWLINNQDYYDSYDRKGPKVYLGEYASHLPGRENNLEAALTIALYLTSVERNGDIVTMTSYAPLLAKEGHVNWRPDLIFFNNDSISLSPDYYVQALYGNNCGNEFIPSEINFNSDAENVKRRFGHSIVKDNSTGDIFVRYVNMLPVPINIKESFNNLGIKEGEVQAQVLSGNPEDMNVKPVEETFFTTKGVIELEIAPYSFYVLKLTTSSLGEN